ncbi:MAG: MoxR family ATPase [Balneola sp.]|nr:MoxR family ATPase [Balneola sp.]MBO6650910.1 MoxR family ATPase [Balneola sp.]MBO6711852.1 MoxR family ATPase [Balneola sp.]MBO6800047.1 MoxR family ATPase [Balneola sp.]MBO6871572.1 MoxR family ATPase [Balneola sp.]
MSEEITNNENPEAENEEASSNSEVPFESRLDLTELQNMISNIRTEIKKIIVGQDNMIDLMICALLADGHILVEGVPGVAKTLTARLFAKTLDTGFSRIQFTPDLMPADITGTSVFNTKTTDFEFKKGPIFSNLVLIDEINRSPAKTQSALFEVMQEKQITVDGNTYKMEAPFLVVATQNPIEHEGTYRLPEAQMDRFLFKIDVGYPSIEEEVQILQGSYNRKLASEIEQLNAVVNAAELNAQRKVISEIHVEKELMEYIAKIVHQTRNSSSIYIGASPRASVFILKAAQAWAAMRGRDFITPEDVKQVIVPTLRHRITLTPEKEMEGIIPDQIIKQLADKVEVPR